MDEQLQRELLLIKIAAEKKRKQQLLLDKQDYITEGKKSNAFLDDVRQDYAKYYFAMIQEKQNQADAVQSIMDHLETLEKANQLADDEIEVIHHDKSMITSELTNIKHELDELIRASSAGQ
jgi:hypothetical protein